MAGASGVRQHQRLSASGTVTTMRRHSRKRRGRALVSRKHAWRNLRKAWRHGRRGRKGMAFMFGALGAGEMASWVALRGLTFMFATFAILALGGMAAASRAGGGRV